MENSGGIRKLPEALTGEDDVRQLKRTILRMSVRSSEGHIASAFSVLDILWALYNGILNVDPRNPAWDARDYFILSKGQASMGLYTVLAEKGFFAEQELEKFSEFSGILGGHPDANKVPGVEASTGSLGHGFPMALGIALGLRIQKKDNRVFVLIGDGESNEGSIWESALLAAHHRLVNLTCILDYNHSNDRALVLGDMKSKFLAFGWNAIAVNGHDREELNSALKAPSLDRPKVIIANTIKGKGCPTMENNPEWHHKSPSEQELKTLLEELR